MGLEPSAFNNSIYTSPKPIGYTRHPVCRAKLNTYAIT